MAKTANYLSYYHPLTLKIISFGGSKNHYIIPKKISIANEKNTYKKQVCNQQ